MAEKYALEALNISKHFGALVALNNVSLQLKKGSFHALLGENGAGKSTLVKCIMGYYTPDSGELVVEGKQHDISNPRHAHQLGLGMVYQHFTLIPNMTVMENLVLARPHLPIKIDWRSERKSLQERIAQLPFQFQLDVPVSSMAAGEKQKLEITKQLLLNSKILILDEPTSVLTPMEADEVLGKLRALTHERALSILIITHKFREVMTFADEVTVLRKGSCVGTATVKSVNTQQLAEMMVGTEFIKKPLQRQPSPIHDVGLEIHHLNVNDDTQTLVIDDLSLVVGGGEIVGIAGVSGNGQRELVETLSGQRIAISGEIHVHKQLYQGKREDMRKSHFYCLPEEPLRNACVPTMSVAENMVFRNFDHPPFTRYGWLLDRHAMWRHAIDLIRQYKVSTPGPHAAIATLSGGNVQRAILARELENKVDILVAANPCFGLDFSAVAEIHGKIMDVRNRGGAVLLISEDLEEILELSDRLVVISAGKLVYETTPAQADLSTIGRYMAGH